MWEQVGEFLGQVQIGVVHGDIEPHVDEARCLLLDSSYYGFRAVARVQYPYTAGKIYEFTAFCVIYQCPFRRYGRCRAEDADPFGEDGRPALVPGLCVRRLFHKRIFFTKKQSTTPKNNRIRRIPGRFCLLSPEKYR